MKIYDTIVIGGGPAGYTAALYAARAGLSVLVLEKLSAGGQMALAEQVDNYPGFPDGIDGFTLAEQMQRQAERFGAESAFAEVLNAELASDPKRIVAREGEFFAKTVILAMGADPRRLDLPGEAELVGRGVAYCAACDAMRYRGKTVAVIGGGNSAVADALTLSRVAKKVYLVHRRDALRASKVYLPALEAAGNIELRFCRAPIALLHESELTGLRLRDTQTGTEETLDCEGVFVSIGRVPSTAAVAKQLSLTSGGYIPAGEDTQTELAGVYAAGDVREKPLRQVVTAVADGAVAAQSAAEYLAAYG